MLLSTLVIRNGLHFERVELAELGDLSNVSAVFSTSRSSCGQPYIGTVERQKVGDIAHLGHDNRHPPWCTSVVALTLV